MENFSLTLINKNIYNSTMNQTYSHLMQTIVNTSFIVDSTTFLETKKKNKGSKLYKGKIENFDKSIVKLSIDLFDRTVYVLWSSFKYLLEQLSISISNFINKLFITTRNKNSSTNQILMSTMR